MIELARYKALTPESYGFINYSLAEVFENIKVLDKDPEVIWNTMKNVFGKSFFHNQIQIEYSEIYSQKDQELLDREIQKIRGTLQF